MPHDTAPASDGGAPEVAELLAGLEPFQRETVFLVYFDGRSLREAAVTLAVPPAAVAAALATAFRRLGRAVVALTAEDQPPWRPVPGPSSTK